MRYKSQKMQLIMYIMNRKMQNKSFNIKYCEICLEVFIV